MSALFMEEEMPKKHGKGMKRYLMIGVIGLALAWAAPAMATNIVTFDPTGTAGPAGDITIDRLDQAPGNAIALGASAGSTVGSSFKLLYQSNLGTAPSRVRFQRQRSRQLLQDVQQHRGAWLQSGGNRLHHWERDLERPHYWL